MAHLKKYIILKLIWGPPSKALLFRTEIKHLLSIGSDFILRITELLFFKWAIPGLFFVYYRIFKRALQLLQQKYIQ